MELKKQNVLMFARSMGLGGTERVVLQLCRILQPKVNKLVVCSCGGVNQAELEQMSIRHYTIPDIENKSPKTVCRVLHAVRRILREEEITVVHTHHRMAAFYMNLLSMGLPVTFVSHCHNTFTDKRELTRLSYRRAKLVACGEMVKKNLVDFYGLPEEQVTVIHNAVEPFDGEIVPVPELEVLRKAGYALVGNVGRLSEQKGMEYFIAALPKVKTAGIPVKFVIVGDGEDREKLEDQTRKLGVEEDVLFLGYRSDVRNVMSQMDLIVLSSLWEGLPLTPIEAFSVGKTVVATAADGTVEILRDKENGDLVPVRDSEAIADRVTELLRSPETRRHYEEQAAETYAAEFSFDTFAQRVEAYYQSL